jgi:glycine/D-amino acid oxidase-like deaminating enzyme
VDQIAGIRPATKDRRPFIGIHPQYKTLAIFNGLGTKGVSIAPYYSGQFADCLISQKELDQDVNINRYISLYNN